MKRKIVSEIRAASCYFRTSVEPPHRKALVQITERCNLHCAHWCISAGNYGKVMSFGDIRDVLIPQLKLCRVASVTLTGGEPFIHPNIIEIASLFRRVGMKVGICTNATRINEKQMEALVALGGVHCNVSLDGFSAQSHGKFRGNKKSFMKTIATVQALAQYRLLQGLLVTPNNLAKVDEYYKPCDFAVKNCAAYVLMNPISLMGRGTRSMNKLAAPNEMLRRIEAATTSFSKKIQLVRIRFPNDKKLPLASCEAGNIIYVFARGELTVCPYLVFAATTPQSLHEVEEFIVGNIFRDADIAEKLDAYSLRERYRLGNNSICEDCQLNTQCGKGCPAAVIAAGKRIEEVDAEVCPSVDR